MEARAKANSEDLNLLREWREPIPPRRIAAAVVGSLVAHVFIISAVVLAPDVERAAQNPAEAVYYRKVPLYIPVELTQRDTNKGQVSRMLDVRSAAAPALVPQAPRFRAPRPAPIPAAAPVPLPEPPKVEPPKIETEVAVAPPPPPPAGRLQVGPPP